MHWLALAGWVFFSAGLGVFLAIPMKRQMVNHEQLPFPTGTAAAVTLRSLYTHGKEAMHKAYGLLVALVVGVVVGVLRTYGTLVDELGKTRWAQPWLERLKSWFFIPEEWRFAGFLNPLTRGHLQGLSLEPSVLLIGAGMIVGNRVNLSMLGGSLLLYFVVAPAMLACDIANAGVAGYIPAFRVADNGDFNPVRWALWGGTSIMVFASLTTLALDWKSVARAFSSFRGRSQGAHDAQLDAIEVPNSWLALGFIPFGAGLVIVMWLAFQISIPLGIVAVLMSSVVSLVCCRVTGETDTTPVGAMGKVTQLLYAVLPGAAGNSTVNLMTAGATTGAGMGSADLLTDLKSGYLLGANPRKQFWAQFIGVFIGTLAIVPGWYLMVPNKAALEKFNPPAVNMWKAVADLLTQGVHLLPRSAIYLILCGAVVGILLPVLERISPRMRRCLPSAMGLGLSWVVPFQNSLSFAIGGVVVWLWTKFNQRNESKYSVPVASGFIAGESIIAALIAISCTLVGFLALK
jgi:OPT family oligopeptide transporter